VGVGPAEGSGESVGSGGSGAALGSAVDVTVDAGSEPAATPFADPDAVVSGDQFARPTTITNTRVRARRTRDNRASLGAIGRVVDGDAGS
jgi:hypothetical protein